MSYEKILNFIESFDTEKIDDKFKDYLKNVKVMTGAGTVQLLNGCVSLIDDDKCFLEIGTHRGSTLLGAALGNKASCYGVDDFSGHNSREECAPFSSIEEGLIDAISKLSSGNVKYFKEDYMKFLSEKKDIDGKKVEVYFYDGDHGKENQYLGLKKCVNVLSKKAIVLVDDSAQQDSAAVWYGVNRLLNEDDRFSFVVEFFNNKPNDADGMWNGTVVLKFEDKN